MTLTPTTRASLLLRLRDPRDHDAWVEFVSLYEPVVYRVLRKTGLQDADALEMLQELFLAVNRNIGRWEHGAERGSFRGWLRRVTRNLVVSFLRIIYFACNVHATSIAVFIRRGFGREALGWNSLCAILVLIFLAGEDRAFLGYVVLFLFAQIWRRIETFRLIRSGVVLHSRYPGYPYIAMKVPFVKDEENAMSGIEPLMCFLGGALLCPVSVSIGGYVMLGALTLGIRGGIEREIDRKRIQQMKDAALEQQWYSEQMRR